MRALTCAQLANTTPDDANFLGAWYSGWWNGHNKRHSVNIGARQAGPPRKSSSIAGRIRNPYRSSAGPEPGTPTRPRPSRSPRPKRYEKVLGGWARRRSRSPTAPQHYRGSFHNPDMYLPLAAGTLCLGASRPGYCRRDPCREATAWAHRQQADGRHPIASRLAGPSSGTTRSCSRTSSRTTSALCATPRRPTPRSNCCRGCRTPSGTRRPTSAIFREMGELGLLGPTHSRSLRRRGAQLRVLWPDRARGRARRFRLSLDDERAILAGDGADLRVRQRGARSRSICRSSRPASGSAASA